VRILYLVHQFYPQAFAGTEKFLLRLAQGCQAAGHTVTVVTYDLPPRAVAPYRRLVGAAGRHILRRLSAWGINLYHWLPRRNAAQPAAAHRIQQRRYTYAGLPVIAYRRRPAAADAPLLSDFVAGVLREVQPDLIHAAHVMRVEDVLHVAADQGLPCLLTLTDFWLICPNCRLQTERDERCWGPQGGRACHTSCPSFHPADIAERLQRGGQLLRSARAITAPTRFLAERIQAEHGPLPIRIIPYGMDGDPQPATMRRSPRRLVFGFAGIFYEAKGIHLLIAAFRRLAAPDVRLMIYGSGRLEARLRKQAAGDARIHFGGVYAPAELGTRLRQLDVLVVPRSGTRTRRWSCWKRWPTACRCWFPMSPA
jgi:glycosyltransferase involved in cell wall biosynthesis